MARLVLRALLCLSLCISLSRHALATQKTHAIAQPDDATHNQPGRRRHGGTEQVSGVWTITRIASLTGPTVAIFLYKKTRDLLDQYGPLIAASMSEMARALQAQSVSQLNGRGFQWLNPLPGDVDDPYVTKIANEVIRLTNLRLREKAVISRIQMDEDQYEFNRRITGAEVREIAHRVMKDVLDRGSGSYLSDTQKEAVRSLVKGSVQ